MGKVNKMVDTAVAIANDDSHGYSQYRRWPYQGTDFDCSSLMYYSANTAGYDVPLNGYTGTMISDFSEAGFAVIAFSDIGLSGLIRGDILLNVDYHTEMCIGDGLFVGAHGSETGSIDGEPGDQTGDEISIVPAYVYWDGWNYVLRPPESDKTAGGFDMVECLFYCKDNYGGYRAGDVVYWSTSSGFQYLEHPDCITLIKKCNPDIAEIENSAKYPWLTRAKQATDPDIAARTYGKRV